ncbi:MAG: hypothetical protein ABR611_15975, partial [Chthoniobacterales bacterium]
MLLAVANPRPQKRLERLPPVLAEAQRRFFYTLSHYSRQFLDLSSRPAVKGLSGLSPAISLAQNETQPSRRATVGTLTDVSELLAVLCARFGEQR